MTKMGIVGKFLLTLAGMSVISQLVHSAGAMLAMGYYRDPQYFPLWSKLMMPNAGPPPSSFYAYSFLFSMVEWGLFLAIFSAIKNRVPGGKPVSRGLVFGAGVFLVGGLSQFLSLGLLINLPYGLISEWALEALVCDLINGALAGRFWGRGTTRRPK